MDRPRRACRDKKPERLIEKTPIKSLSHRELRAECSRQSLSATGTAVALRDRLREAAAYGNHDVGAEFKCDLPSRAEKSEAKKERDVKANVGASMSQPVGNRPILTKIWSDEAAQGELLKEAQAEIATLKQQKVSLSTKLSTANATISRSSTRLAIREGELKKVHEKLFVTHQLRHEAEKVALMQELQILRQTISERDAQLVELTVAQRPALPEEVEPEDVTEQMMQLVNGKLGRQDELIDQLHDRINNDAKEKDTLIKKHDAVLKEVADLNKEVEKLKVDLEAKDSYWHQVVAMKEDGPSLPKRKRK